MQHPAQKQLVRLHCVYKLKARAGNNRVGEAQLNSKLFIGPKLDLVNLLCANWPDQIISACMGSSGKLSSDEISCRHRMPS